MSEPTVESLRAQVLAATEASQRAHRDSSRLIRLLSVIGEPAPPDRLTDRSLGALSEVFSADVTGIVYVDGPDVRVVAARGFAEGEEPVLGPLPGIIDELGPGRSVAWQCPATAEPPRVAGVPIRAAAAVPMDTDDAAAGSLVLLRSDPSPFERLELPMLQSVAARLHASIEEGRRRQAVERLAHTGHRFTRHLDQEPLYDEALALLCEMTGAERAAAVVVEDGLARPHADEQFPEVFGADWPKPVEEFAAWRHVRGGEALVAADLHATLAAGLVPPSMRHLRSLLCVPIMLDGEPAALLYAFHSRPGYFTRSAADPATVLAAYLASALANSRLLHAVSQSEARLRMLTDELRRQATHDSLTGLANRDLARDLLEVSLTSPAAVSGHVGLLFCDLDKFKAVNDRLGHEAGDDLLRQVAARLAACVRRGDLLARLGGDEFVVVLPSVTDLDMVTAIGTRVLTALEEPFDLDGEQVRVTASVGGVVGERGPEGATAVELLRDADAAMYAAKNRGRGRVEVFDRHTARSAVERLALREELQTAHERDELELYYQPIVALTDGRIIGFEALMRWNHPRLGMVPPNVFIPMAEETGAVVPIGWWALREACRRLAAWQGRYSDGLTMAVNVSALQLADASFPERAVEVMRSAGLRVRDVWLEITESVPVTDELVGRLGRLRAAGVRVAMDDFGTSYSNLGYLKRLPIERLKIDREFVRGLGEGPAGTDRIDRGIVRAVLALAESAGMSVVAEGIETEEQRRILLELGCERGQGFLFAPPRPAPAVEEALTRAGGALLTG